MGDITTIKTENEDALERILAAEMEKAIREDLGGLLILEEKYADLFDHLRDKGASTFDLTNPDKESLNTGFNPFETADDSTCTYILYNLMDDAGGDGALWKGRAVALFAGLMKVLCWLRDEGKISLNAKTIEEHLSLGKLIDLSYQNVQKTNLEIPKNVRAPLQSYFTSLPRGPQVAQDQHQYLARLFGVILGGIHHFNGPGERDGIRNHASSLEAGKTVVLKVSNRWEHVSAYEIAAVKLSFFHFLTTQKAGSDKKTICCVTGYSDFADKHQHMIREANADVVFAETRKSDDSLQTRNWTEGLLNREETGNAKLKTAGEHIREASKLIQQLTEGGSSEVGEETGELMGLERGDGGEGIKTHFGTLQTS